MGKVNQIIGDRVFVSLGEEEFKVLKKDEIDFEIKVGDEVIYEDGKLSKPNIKKEEKNIDESIPDIIKKYKELLDMGAITEEEFEKQKAKLLE